MEKRWQVKPHGDQQVISLLCDVLNVSPCIANLLSQRGINDYDEAKDFFRPGIDKLHNPFLMKDMDVAVDRLQQAIEHNERILVYGDYDVDGTTGVALLFLFLKNELLQERHKDRLFYYIPDRYEEGYGISYKGIDFAEEHDCTLIIAVDCGIKGNQKIAYAKEKGIDVLVCDHHLPGEKLPDATAVLDPKRKDCSYPFKELSGCGIGFKLIQGFILKTGKQPDILKQYVDLLAVSIGADIVPITGENRILTYLGVQKLNENPCNGLYSIMKIAGIEQKEVNVEDIVFRIGPRINAAGRMKSGSSAVELLVSEHPDLGEQIGKEIDAHNSHRKDVDRKITEEALALINSSDDLIHAKSTVVYNDYWHKGVVGIVASRLIESFYRPTIVLTKSNGMVTGSGRSILGFDLYNAINECSDLLENYGGHCHAAGLSLKEINVPAFQKKFEALANQQLTSDMLIPRLDIDAEIELAEITSKLYRILRQFEPCGPGNMTPVFCSRNVVDRGTAKPVGKHGDHLKLTIYQDGCAKGIPAIAFQQGSKYEAIKNASCFDVCYTIDLNHFNGRSTLQLNVKDIKVPG